MDFQQVLEALGVLISGALFYSYTYSWFPPGHPQRARWWTAVLGLSFGMLSILMMLSRIQIARDVYIDARLVPVALIGLFEGWRIGLLAGLVAAAYRVWLGGPGAWAEVAALALMGVAAGLVHRWAGGADRVGQRHAIVVTAIAFALTSLWSAAQGPGGMHAFSLVRVPYLVMLVAGIAFLARLFHDVVEQNRLATAHERFRAILDEASDAIRIVDPESQRILDCNRADCELSGAAREQMLGRDIRDFWPEDPELRVQLEADLAEARQKGFARTLGLSYRTLAGQLIPIDSTRRVVEYLGRRYEIVIFRDAHERLAAETAEREAAELRSVTLLAGAAAHEINNPLAVIVGYLQLLEGRFPGDSREGRWIAMSLDATRRIKESVARLRSITRIEATKPTGSAPAILDTRKSSAKADGE
ncbi:MAG TPA: LytS/YhcK type 5TM receptor domain-containing protein [Methylomirabilota bacterium]|nr:LytS/YhcK type 5TM receptor domain-containing protein [Methylomirabilota bacterium]